MTTPGPGATNTAQDSATVGVQAEAVHGDVYNTYHLSPEDSPEKKAQVGIECLRGGMAETARQYLRDALMGGHATNRSCYYVFLAVLSGRTLQQIPEQDHDLLRVAQEKVAESADDPWIPAIHVIGRLTSLDTGDAEHETIENELGELQDDRRNEILRHLEMFLNGTIQEGLWERAFDSARQNRCRDQRLERAWKFFQPKPIEPRVRPPHPVETTPAHWVKSIAALIGCLTSAGFIVVQAWQHGRASTAAALLLTTAGAAACARSGVEWRFLAERLRATKRAHTAVRHERRAPQHGFANQIDHRFDHYFARYVPRGTDRETWLEQTAGIRQSLRDEIVQLYRESRIDAERVAWLIRYLVSDVRQRWENGTLWEHRHRLRVPTTTKTTFLLGTAAFAVGAIATAWNGLHTHALGVTGATLAALATGWLTTTGGLSIAVEHKRFAADHTDSERERAKRTAAFECWKAKLADKPRDVEMAGWLDCDRKALMEEAMRHYKLKPRDIIAHAFIEAPATSYRRARLWNGPWRYSRYRLLAFLLTTHGVRQTTVELNFEKASFHKRERVNYRYDAVAAVQVNETDSGHTVFNLALVDGNPIEVTVTGPPSDAAEPEEETRNASQITLDTAGLSHTLHVLEGVAAEGREWIAHQRRPEKIRLPDLAKATRNIFS